MKVSPGLFMLSLFIVGGTVYFAAQANDEGAWLYVVILLLGLMLSYGAKNFALQLYNLGFEPVASPTPPTPAGSQPQQHGNF